MIKTQEFLDKAVSIDEALGAALLDHETGTCLETKGGILGLLFFPLGQMNKASRRLKPLRPADGALPLQRLNDTDLDCLSSSLGDLRRLTGRPEAELRLLTVKTGENGRRRRVN